MELKEYLYDPWRRLLGKKGEQVKLISDHSGVLIVQNDKGQRFAVRKELTTNKASQEPKSKILTAK